MAGAVSSTAIGSHFDANLEDLGTNVALIGHMDRPPDALPAYRTMITRTKQLHLIRSADHYAS
ncbi:hypothetical protein GCM10010365_32150 [Streptomyces poonensis]|uniref:Uncharacterized protein n=1 Tax=Streptomyces poonensis TaxID=68255 RepID=A0A918PJ34_9ACTN|nr:hypothetical protein GCM10010365_32150 [Streptomyces poonensis]GLJ91378.1 hypothetical protein GCM10017589_39850 [Streptomyces poonensis]